MYADKVTPSMQRTIDETNRRREKQLAYNQQHGITPQPIIKSKNNILGQVLPLEEQVQSIENKIRFYDSLDNMTEASNLAADPIVKYMSKDQLEKAMIHTKKAMEKAAKDLDFMEAARLRDEYFALQKLFDLNH